MYLALVADTGNSLPPLVTAHFVFVGAITEFVDGASLTFTYITLSSNTTAVETLAAPTKTPSDKAI
jgi:hypothetical protein